MTTAYGTGDALVEARGVSAGYDGAVVLDGVDLTVHAGEVVALLGANGSGKSTLVKTVVALLPTLSGEVRLFGTPLAGFRGWHRVGYVPQRTTAAAGVPATVHEVVCSGRIARVPWWRPMSVADRRVVAEAIAQVQLSGLEQRSVSELSGGQQQRVLIARALSTEPELLVLDEPTAGVDAATQEVLARVLRDRVAQGAAVLLVAHELGPLLPLIDRAVVMRVGRVSYDGPLTPPLAQALEEDHVHPHQHEDRAGPWGLR